MLTPVRALVLALAAAAALALASCGGGGGGGLADDDPATLAPADAPFYLQATLRPKGEAKANTESLASTITGFDDPFGELVSYVDQNINDEPTLSGRKLSFEKDIEPWAGSKGGLFVQTFSGDDPPAAGIVQTTDPEATQRFIDDAKQKGDTDASYKGVDYLVDGDDGTAIGVVDDFFVAGDEPAFKQVVDVSKGAESLADQGEFTEALDGAPEGSLVDGHLDVERVVKQAEAEDPSTAQGVDATLGDTSGRNALFSLIPNKDSIELDATTNLDQNFTGGDLSSLIESFPDTSFVALGVPDLGALIDKAIDQLDQGGVPGLSRSAIDEQLSQAGLSLDEITGALGDLGIFVSGQDRATLQGAGVIQTKDPAAAEKLISKLTAITGLAQLSGDSGVKPAPIGQGISITDPQEIGPQPLVVTTLNDKIAIGYGEQATAEALGKGGAGTLADDPTYKQAVGALGGNGVSGYVSLDGVFRLADALGSLDDPQYQQARPYLQHLTYFIFGSGEGGDRSSSKAIVGVRP